MTLFPSTGQLHPLRWTQVDAIPLVKAAVKEGHKHIMLLAPTGYGKTVLGAHLIHSAQSKGKRCIFLAPAIGLINQTLASFENQGLRDIGVMQQRHERTNPYAGIQIASWDTLVRRQIPDVDFIINDEAHERRQDRTAILQGAWKNKIVIGLSATPYTRGLGLDYSKLIILDTTKSMIEQSRLASFRIFGVPLEDEPDMTGVKTVTLQSGEREYDDAGAAAVMSQDRIVGSAVDTWLRHRQAGHHPGNRTFLYGKTRAHAKIQMEAFQAAGVPFGYMDGESGPDERRDCLEAYREHRIAGICNVGVLIRGIDEDVRCIVDCDPTKSEIRHVQKIGRGLRLAEGKDLGLLILDHAGNNTRLGMVTDIHHDTLDTRGPKDKGDAYEDERPAAKPRKCQNCNAIIPPATRACPSCGDVYQAPNTIEHVPGELVEMSLNGKAAPKVKKPKRDVKVATMASLKAMARDGKISEKSIGPLFKKITGSYPRGMDDVLPAYKPDCKVSDFVWADRKAYKESRKSA